ncbi:fluoride efflux transporter FluC [uncultured Friedmanniella sp.]|uniref:fluoride efflux transporter FluC n=1 Tax=uncultured Friedmanniella sp. TaxID=335381 RepID=UPI0035CB99C0
MLVCLAGGVGAAARFTLDGAIRGRVRAAYPVATAVINLSGSFALGLVTGLALGRFLDPSWQLVIGTGLLGGYTTFSTASFEVSRLLEERRWLAGGVHLLGTVVAAAALAAAGLGTGLAVAR